VRSRVFVFVIGLVLGVLIGGGYVYGVAMHRENHRIELDRGECHIRGGDFRVDPDGSDYCFMADGSS
jgi:hypothetical protein